jgi:phage terminase large subunit GpA-like protein
LEWFRENIFAANKSPYSHSAYPHIGAPGGPCDALDDPRVKTIWLQWASRLGKTFFGQCALMYFAATNPSPMMLASESENLAVQVTSRTYQMLEECSPLKDQLRPAYKRKQNQIDFDNCKVYVAWARSVGTLADKAVRFGHANEIDKWEHQSTSKEADPLKLFDDRFKEFPSHKRIKESTPTVKGKSRVERGRIGSTNCRFYVPCPNCGHYQTLRMDRMKWDHDEGGRSSRDLSRRTAAYHCESCDKSIVDERRGIMLRRGVWCPEGATVNSERAAELFDDNSRVTSGYKWTGWRNAKWIEGTPSHDDADAGYQLSSLYALTLGWGDVAAEFVEVKDRPQLLRNFINQWMGETWELANRKQTWEKLGERIIAANQERYTLPEWASLVTVGCDRQIDKFVYVVDAWGPDRRSTTIDYGEAENLGDIRERVISKFYPHVNGFTLIDSGYKPLGVHEFCIECLQSGLQVWPCKGSATALNAEYQMSTLGKNTAMPGMKLFHIDTIRTQTWLDNQIHSLTKDDPTGTSVFNGPLAAHQDFLEQLLNDAAILDLDKHNNDREAWERISTDIPNDFRDCKRYAYVAMLIATRGAAIRPPAKVEQKQAAKKQSNPHATRPDGRPWI